jgi:hypothetical protein
VKEDVRLVNSEASLEVLDRRRVCLLHFVIKRAV